MNTTELDELAAWRAEWARLDSDPMPDDPDEQTKIWERMDRLNEVIVQRAEELAWERAGGMSCEDRQALGGWVPVEWEAPQGNGSMGGSTLARLPVPGGWLLRYRPTAVSEWDNQKTVESGPAIVLFIPHPQGV